MSTRLSLAVFLTLLGGCMDMSSLPHGNLGMPDMSGSPGFGDSQFNNKNYADPNPHSLSDDQQRAAFQQHQQEQDDAARMNSGPDLSHMSSAPGAARPRLVSTLARCRRAPTATTDDSLVITIGDLGKDCGKRC